MNRLWMVVLVIAAVLVLLGLFRTRRGVRKFSYRAVTHLLSPAERSYYGVLFQAIGKEYLVFAKVRVADVLSPRKASDRSQWQRAFNAISAKHFDFLICDPKEFAVKLAVELDDASHGSIKRQKRDRWLDDACASAKMPLLRVRASKSYVVGEVRRQVKSAMASEGNPSGDTLVPRAADGGLHEVVGGNTPEPAGAVGVDAGTQSSSSPPCPKCNAAMILRNAKSGSHAGKTFWGCSTFPKCRGVLARDG